MVEAIKIVSLRLSQGVWQGGFLCVSPFNEPLSEIFTPPLVSLNLQSLRLVPQQILVDGKSQADFCWARIISNELESHGHPVLNPAVMLAISSLSLAVFDAAAACAGLLKPAKDVGRKELKSVTSMIERIFTRKATTISQS